MHTFQFHSFKNERNSSQHFNWRRFLPPLLHFSSLMLWCLLCYMRHILLTPNKVSCCLVSLPPVVSTVRYTATAVLRTWSQAHTEQRKWRELRIWSTLSTQYLIHLYGQLNVQCLFLFLPLLYRLQDSKMLIPSCFFLWWIQFSYLSIKSDT